MGGIGSASVLVERGPRHRSLVVAVVLAMLVLGLPAQPRSLLVEAGAASVGTDVAYTSDADFDAGTLVSVNHDAPFNDQLQLDSPTEPFPFINVAASGRGTVVRVNTDTGEIVGEYRTAPEGRGLDPSRTTVDLFGNVWTANRGEVDEIDGVPHGSAVKIGLIVGGTRADASGQPNVNGGYVAPPFGYSTCVDRDGDGLIRTSSGLLDVLDWPDVTDGVGGTDGVVDDAVDECVLLYQRLSDAEQARHVSVDADNNVWVGGYPFGFRTFHKLDGTTGAVLDSFDARQFGCGGYGGLIDGNGILWSIGWGSGEGPLLRYDPATRTGSCVNTFGGYGLGIDTNGYVWASIWENGIVKVSPDGVVEPGFPKSTWLPSTTSTETAAFSAPATPTFEPVSVANPSVMPQMTPSSSSTAAVPVAAAPDEAPDFWLAPDDDWVQSLNPWSPGSTVSMTIADGSGTLYSDSQTVDPGGNFNFNLWDVFDVQRGHTVTVSDGATTKTHQVLDLFVDGIDVVADTVFGRAAAGTEVQVWVHDTDASIIVTADGSGNWTADFSGLTDLTYASNGGSGQADDDGDATGVWWSSPTFTVVPDDDWVGSTARWSPGSTVSMTIADGSGTLYSDSQTVDPGGNFNFNLGGVFDVQRGHTVTMSDGTTTKTHQVLDLFVDGIDVTADTVFGRADSGTEVQVWVHSDDSNLDVTADGSGNWTADFSGLIDLTYASDGNSQQVDDDGDATWDFWSSPQFWLAPDDDWVQSLTRWTPGLTVSLTIADGSGTLYSDSQTVDPGGNFNFNLWDVFDVERGHTVTVSDGATTKTHQVLDLFVDGIDVVADTVFGRAAAGTEVQVWVHDTDANIIVTADGSGNWTADFSGLTDLTYASNGGSGQADDDGDATGVWWALPSFTAAPDDDWVQSMNSWTPGSTVSLTIEDASGVVYSDSQVADPGGGYFNFNLGGVFDLQRGQTVTVTDGTTTKTLVVTNPDVTELNADANLVSGTAEPFAQLDVGAAPNPWSEESWRGVTADAAGAWTADFSVPSGGFPPIDIDATTVVSVQERDDDGDGTQRNFGPPVQANRGVAVTPVDNHVWVASSGIDAVTRLDNDGNVLKIIPTGAEPTGVAVDAAGKVWVTNQFSDNTVRIDPGAGSDGLGAVDLTVDLGEGAGPYNYSDMTGAVVVGSTSPQGFWTVVQDSGEAGFEWGRITWNTEPEASEPVGTEIVVEARTSDSEAGLGGAAFVPVSSGELFSSFGRFIELRVTLKASPEGLGPVLSDIRVQPALIEVDVDIKPGSYPNSINIKRTTGVIPVAVLGGDDFDVSTIDVSTLRFGPNQALPAHDLTNLKKHLADVDGDGYVDLVSHYVVGETGLDVGDTEACLTGETVDGVPIEGCDSVRVFWP